MDISRSWGRTYDVVLHIGERRHVRQVHAEIVVEPPGSRTIQDGLVQMPFEGLLAIARWGHAAWLRPGPFPAEVPLADQGRLVPVFAEHPRQRGTIVGDQRRFVSCQHPLLQAGAPRVPPGQQAVAGRRADRRRAVGIGEAHALLNELVQVGGSDLVVWVVRLDISDAEVIGQNQHDVRGPLGRFRRAGAKDARGK